jgi:peptidoglycan/xylan/chitin deacetylase (PgdA/CDA1 family)
MGAVTRKHAAESVPCRFLFGDNGANDVFAEWLAADMQAARLSPAFRAYYLLRGLIPLRMRQMLQRSRPVKAAADWYVPRDFLDSLAEQIAALPGGLTTIHPWPDDAKFAFVLTHDVETAEGMRRIGRIADLEEELGFRSSWNVVPHKYPVDFGILRELAGRGFEIGVHGYNHDGKLFANRSVFGRRVLPINTALESFGAVGFRAPMVHRNLAWLQALDIEYDASCFDADPFQAMPGGVGGVWPFVAGRFVELPYTLPQDHTLFVAMNEPDGRIWQRKLDLLAELHGMALVITHPDYLDEELRIAAYRRLLCRAREMDGMWHALPKEVAAWWRDRDHSILRRETRGAWSVSGPAACRARAAVIRAVASDSSKRREHAPALTIEWTEAQTLSKSAVREPVC